MSRVLCGVVACLFAATPVARADDAVEKALARVAELGGTVTRDEKRPGKPLVLLHLNGASVTDATLIEMAPLKAASHLALMSTAVTEDGLKELGAFREVQSLYLDGLAVTAVSLKHVAALPKLKSLMLHRCAVADDGLHELASSKSLESHSLSGLTDAGLENLAGCRGLQCLFAADAAVTDAGLKRLDAFPTLRALSLESTEVTDDGLRNLASLPGAKRLWILNLQLAKVSDGGLKVLAAYESLFSLRLAGPDVTDLGMRHLVPLKKKLTKLSLAKTAVTDEAFLDLVKLTGLTELDVTGTQVTAEGVAAFRKLRPKCAVTR